MTPSYTTREKGTGLGLSLSYGLINEHGGEITVASTPGEGTTFTIVLPIIAEAPPADSDMGPTPHPPPRLRRKKGVVVDDEPNVAQMLSTTLQCMGHQAEAVSSGREALEKIASQAYDSIICDMRMPAVDGRQIYQFIQRQHPDLLNRLVFSSGDTVSEEHKQFFQDTQCLFLPKPFRLEELERVISQVSVRGMA